MLFATVTRAHLPINCFTEGAILGPTPTSDDSLVENSDLSLITSLRKDHQLTSVKVCTDRNITYIKGIQVTYGLFTNLGEITEAVNLFPFGDLNQATSVCTNFYIPQDDYIANV